MGVAPPEQQLRIPRRITAAIARPFSLAFTGAKASALTCRNAAGDGYSPLRGKMACFPHLLLRRTIGDAPAGARK
jgi:hypothetical protein